MFMKNKVVIYFERTEFLAMLRQFSRRMAGVHLRPPIRRRKSYRNSSFPEKDIKNEGASGDVYENKGPHYEMPEKAGYLRQFCTSFPEEKRNRDDNLSIPIGLWRLFPGLCLPALIGGGRASNTPPHR